MTRKEFIDCIPGIEIKKEVSDQLAAVYGENIPALILKILSSYPAPELFDENESRTLSLNEVLHAEETNGVAFKSRGLVPIVDLGCDDHIVYDTDNRQWGIYNILDELLYNESDSFERLFLG